MVLSAISDGLGGVQATASPRAASAVRWDRFTGSTAPKAAAYTSLCKMPHAIIARPINAATPLAMMLVQKRIG